MRILRAGANQPKKEKLNSMIEILKRKNTIQAEKARIAKAKMKIKIKRMKKKIQRNGKKMKKVYSARWIGVVSSSIVAEFRWSL